MTSRRRHPQDNLPIPDREKGRFTMDSKQVPDRSHYQTLPAGTHRRSEYQGFTTRPRTTENRRQAQAYLSPRDVQKLRSLTGDGGHKNSGFDLGRSEGRLVEQVMLDTGLAKHHRRPKKSGDRHTRGSDVRKTSKSIVTDQREGRRHDNEKVRRREKEDCKVRGDSGRSRSKDRRYVEDRSTERWNAEMKHQVELIQEYPYTHATVDATSPRKMGATYPGEDPYYSYYIRDLEPEVQYNATDDQTARVSARANKREKSSRHAAAEWAHFHQSHWTKSYDPAYDSTQKHGDVRHGEAERQVHPVQDLEAIRDAKPPSYETFQQLKKKGQISSDYVPTSSELHEPREGCAQRERALTSDPARLDSVCLPQYKIPPIYPNSQHIIEQRHEHVEEYQPCTAPSGACPAQAIVHRSSRSGEAIFCLISRANTKSLHDGTRSEDAPFMNALLKDSAVELDSRPESMTYPLVSELQRTLRARGERQNMIVTKSDSSQAVQMAPVKGFQHDKRSAWSWSESDGRGVHYYRDDRSRYDYRHPEVSSSNELTHTNEYPAEECGGGPYSESTDTNPNERHGGNRSQQKRFFDTHSSTEDGGHHQEGNWWRGGEMCDLPRKGLPRTLHDQDHYLPGPVEQKAKAAIVGEYRSNVTTQKFGPSARRHEEVFGRHLPRTTEWHHLEAIRELDDTNMRQQHEDLLPQPGHGSLTQHLAQWHYQPELDRQTRLEGSAPYWNRNSPGGPRDVFDRVNHRSRLELIRPGSSYPDIAIIDASDTAITATYINSKDYVYHLPADNVSGSIVHWQQAMPKSNTAEIQTPQVNHTVRDQVEVHKDPAQHPAMSACQAPDGTDLHPLVPWQMVVGEIQEQVKEVFVQIGQKEKENEVTKEVKETKKLEKGSSLSELRNASISPKESLSERASRILGISISEETLNVLTREIMAGASNSSHSSHAISGDVHGQPVAKLREKKVTRDQNDHGSAGEVSDDATFRVDVSDNDVKHLEKSDGVSVTLPIIEDAKLIQTEDTLTSVEQNSSQQASPMSMQNHELHAVPSDTSDDGGGGSSEAGGVGVEGRVCLSSKFEKQPESARSSSPREGSVTSCSSSDCSTDTVIIMVRSGAEANSHEPASATDDVYPEAAEAALETEAVEATIAETNNEPQETMARSGKTKPPPLPRHPPPKCKEKRGDDHHSEPDKPPEQEQSCAEVPCTAPSEDSSTWSQDDQDSSFSSDCSGSVSEDEAAGTTPDAHGCRAEIKKKFAKTKPQRSGKQRKLGRQCKAQ